MNFENQQKTSHDSSVMFMLQIQAHPFDECQICDKGNFNKKTPIRVSCLLKLASVPNLQFWDQIAYISGAIK